MGTYEIRAVQDFPLRPPLPAFLKLAAYQGVEEVGFINVHHHPERHSAYLEQVYVAPAHRRGGLADQLLAAVQGRLGPECVVDAGQTTPLGRSWLGARPRPGVEGYGPTPRAGAID